MTPIPVEGDIQIFANPECTEYADGTRMPVYARVNVPWDFGEGWKQSGGFSGAYIDCYGPANEYPNDQYGIALWADFYTEDSETPFTAGQVLEITGDNSMLPVQNPTVIFTKP